MNKDLIGFIEDTGKESLKIPILRKVFKRDILETATRGEIVELLATEPFLYIDRIQNRLSLGLDSKEGICLLEIVNFYNIDYLTIVRKRLRSVGVTKKSLLDLFESIVDEVEKNDLLTLVEKISGNEKFLEFWEKKIKPIVPHLYDLIYILDIDDLLLSYKEAEEVVPIVTDDTVTCSELIVKFESFKQKNIYWLKKNGLSKKSPFFNCSIVEKILLTMFNIN